MLFFSVPISLYISAFNQELNWNKDENKPKNEDLINKKKYIETFKYYAIEEMLRAKIPASITLAQGLFESGIGTSRLALEANNHFGIKCKSEWTGPYILEDDDEHKECFRKYTTPFDSYKDHSDFLTKSQRYAFLFELPSTDYKGWAVGLKKAGYATNPKYSQKLIEIIEEFKLHELDLINTEQFALMYKPEINSQQLLTNENESTNPEIKDTIMLNLIEKTENDHQPGELITINGLKALIASDGDSYLKIAHKNNITLWQLYEYNDFKKNSHLNKGDIVYLQQKRSRSKEEIHTVSEGETMHSISQKYGIKLRSLYNKNRLQIAEEPATGQQISLKRKFKVSETPLVVNKQGKFRKSGFLNIFSSNQNNDEPNSKKLNPNKYIYYTVQDGESIYNIASRHGLSVDDVKKMNNLDFNYLNPGDVLIVGKKEK